MPQLKTSKIKFLTAKNHVQYPSALQAMQETIKTVRQNGEGVIWFLEHPSLYTAGTSSNPSELLDSSFPVFESQRGGKHTYHGPGQLVVYIMIDLKQYGNDIKQFVETLEEWIIKTIKEFGLIGVRKQGRVGVWLDDAKGERKIAAIGVRVTRGITWHGLSINVNTDLSHYQGIIPCGIKDYGITSLQAEGVNTQVDKVIEIMKSVAETKKFWDC